MKQPVDITYPLDPPPSSLPLSIHPPPPFYLSFNILKLSKLSKHPKPKTHTPKKCNKNSPKRQTTPLQTLKTVKTVQTAKTPAFKTVKTVRKQLPVKKVETHKTLNPLLPAQNCQNCQNQCFFFPWNPKVPVTHFLVKCVTGTFDFSRAFFRIFSRARPQISRSFFPHFTGKLDNFTGFFKNSCHGHFNVCHGHFWGHPQNT